MFETLGGSICCVLRRSEALGGSICYVLRGSEALGGSFVCVLRVLEALGGSLARILRVREAPGGVQPLTKLRSRVGPLPKNLRPEASEALRLAEARVLRVLEVSGSSFVCILRVREVPGGSRLKPSYDAGWVPFLST